MEIRPVGAELFHTDGQSGWQTDKYTDTTKLIVAFHNFLNAHKNCYIFRRPQGVSKKKECKHQYINMGSTVPSSKVLQNI